MLEAILALGAGLLLIVVVVMLSIWVMKACDSCNHSYERVDTANDKKMILVCRRCGKIKTLRK